MIAGFLIVMALAAIVALILLFAYSYAAVAGDAQDRGDAMGGGRGR